MMFQNSIEMKLKLNFIKPFWIYRRSNYLFDISNFIPSMELQTNKSSKDCVNVNMYSGFLESLRIKNIQVLPVVHAKNLTGEEIAEIASQKQRDIQSIPISEKEVQDFISKETGTDRLKRMFSRDAVGKFSDEVGFCWSVSVKSALLTYLGFYILKFRELQQEFARENKATVFETVFKANRRRRDKVNLGALKYAFSMGTRIFGLVFTALIVSQAISVYRCKTSVWEYVFGTGIACSINRFYLGPRGLTSGLVTGMVIGIPLGITTVFVLKLLNNTQEEMYYWKVMEILQRQKALKGLTKKKDDDTLGVQFSAE